jgi:hypothetical protein
MAPPPPPPTDDRRLYERNNRVEYVHSVKRIMNLESQMHL